MLPKLGKLISAVSPTAPEQVFPADPADPEKAAQLKAEQISQKTGKYGEPKGEPFKASAEANITSQGTEQWVEIVLVDEDGKPAAGQKYAITLPNGKVVKGSTDNKGKAKVSALLSGTWQLTLPELDADVW